MQEWCKWYEPDARLSTSAINTMIHMLMRRVKNVESKRGIRGRSLSGHGERLGEASTFLSCGLLASVFDQESMAVKHRTMGATLSVLQLRCCKFTCE